MNEKLSKSEIDKMVDDGENILELKPNDLSNVFAIGLVKYPAIEEDFIYLNKEEIKLKQIDEKRIVVGPALIPNIPIRRNGCYIFFSEETVITLAHRFLNSKSNNNTTYDHLIPIKDGVYLNESWIVENENDKINSIYNFNVPVGTWCLSYYIENDEIWNDVKSGKINGFSIEGEKFDIEKLSVEEQELNDLNLLDELINKLKEK